MLCALSRLTAVVVAALVLPPGSPFVASAKHDALAFHAISCVPVTQCQTNSHNVALDGGKRHHVRSRTAPDSSAPLEPRRRPAGWSIRPRSVGFRSADQTRNRRLSARSTVPISGSFSYNSPAASQ